MSKNTQRLGATLANRMKQTSNAVFKPAMELGTVNDNLSITPDSLRVPIPKGDYMVNLMLTGGTTTSTVSHTHDGGGHSHSGADHSHSGGSHSHSGGAHSHELPSAFRGLKSGDRILIAWCGTEPVVVAIVTGS